MYLTARRHLSDYIPEESDLAEAIGATLDTKIGAVKQVSLSAGYWRKANSIHNWFVKTVQDGVDECQESHVTLEQLQELLAIVTMVLDDVSLAEEILPPHEGFFFGSTDIDEYYLRDLEDTKEILEKILKSPDAKNWSYFYQASW